MLDFFKRRPRAWVTPGGTIYKLFDDMAKQPHLLIAGATGSGKSVVINGIIYTLLHQSPATAEFIFIDPKRVELVQYKTVPHCNQYASEPAEMVQALNLAMRITDARYITMQREGQREYTGSALYVVIDELADLMTTQKKQVQPIIQRLCQVGRAANVHVIAATQCPLREVIPTAIKCNFDARVALRTRSAQDSRNIMGAAGCELLPRYGQGFYMKPEETVLYKIPFTTDEEIKSICNYWTSPACKV